MSEYAKKPLLIEAHYLPSIAWMKLVSGYDEVVLDTTAHFVKASYRNRAHILGANGVLSLSIPLAHGREQRCTMGTIKISYDEDWRKNHWMAMISSYKRSAYFEYLEDLFAPIYQRKYETLMELNMALLHVLFSLLKISKQLKFTEAYIPEGTPDFDDFRNKIKPKDRNPLNLEFNPYIQVFSDRFPFQENLSIIDAIFNQGNINLKDL